MHECVGSLQHILGAAVFVGGRLRYRAMKVSIGFEQLEIRLFSLRTFLLEILQ